MGHRRCVWLTLAAVVVAVLALAAGCGDANPGTPSPEAIDTAESASRPVSIPASYSTTPASGDDEQEPIVLEGRVFGAGPAGVILAHMRPSDQMAWFPYATELARTENFTVLTFNFRGYGESTGEKQFDRIDTDLRAAYDYMREELHINNVFLVGASMGGTASLAVAARADVAGVVAVSAQSEFPPGQADVAPVDALEAVARIRAPKLFITSEDDAPQARSQEELFAAASEPKEQHVYTGDVHGTDLFASEHAEDFKRRVTAFLMSHWLDGLTAGGRD